MLIIHLQVDRYVCVVAAQLVLKVCHSIVVNLSLDELLLLIRSKDRIIIHLHMPHAKNHEVVKALIEARGHLIGL